MIGLTCRIFLEYINSMDDNMKLTSEADTAGRLSFFDFEFIGTSKLYEHMYTGNRF